MHFVLSARIGILGGSLRFLPDGHEGKGSLWESRTCQTFLQEYHIADADIAMHVPFLIVVQITLNMA
jgi:hypothetical protein